MIKRGIDLLADAAGHDGTSECDRLVVLVDQLLEAQAAAHVGSWQWVSSSRTVTWSPELYRIVGRDPSEFIPTYDSVRQVLHEGDRGMVDELQHVTMTSGQELSLTARIVRPDGTIRWIESTAQALSDRGTVVGLFGTSLDVTDRHLAEAALRESESRYRTIVDTTTEGIWAVDAIGNTTFVNHRMAEMLGYRVDEMLGRPVFDFLDVEGRRIAAESLRRQENNRAGDRFDFRFFRRSGSELWTLASTVPLYGADGNYEGAQAMFADITERKAAEASLAHSATHDILTGLPNRTLLLDRLDVALARHQRHGRHLAVLFCDLDHFKYVNDSLGHDAGDLVLAAVAERLVAGVRAGDTVARLGGDEFVMCCEDLDDAPAAQQVAVRIARMLVRPIMVAGREIFVTASIGIRMASPGGDRGSDLVRDADIAMYKAKETGRATWSMFDDSLRTRADHRLQVESDLHHAIERGELRVYYQPIYSVSDGGPSGVEALVRWQHPTRGLLMPADFVDVAEDTGMVVPMGLWVLDEACQQLRAWSEMGAAHVTMAVNVSPRQLSSPDLVGDMAEILARTAVAPQDVCLEITENGLMQDLATAELALRSLKELGLRLAIDDFGTGYSSLSYLRRFPIDVLKIDRSFIAQLGTDAESTAIVTTVIHLARALGLDIVAEGVETRQQLSQLEVLGCPEAQGYYWSKAVPPEELSTTLRLRGEMPVPAAAVHDGRITVLVADDETAHRSAVKRILESSGHFTVVAEAGDGQQAVRMADEQRPDLVVLDLSMPKMDGLEALPRILAAAPDTKVALLSGHIGRAPLADGAAVRLQKGIKPAELVEDLLLVMGRSGLVVSGST